MEWRLFLFFKRIPSGNLLFYSTHPCTHNTLSHIYIPHTVKLHSFVKTNTRQGKESNKNKNKKEHDTVCEGRKKLRPFFFWACPLCFCCVYCGLCSCFLFFCLLLVVAQLRPVLPPASILRRCRREREKKRENGHCFYFPQFCPLHFLLLLLFVALFSFHFVFCFKWLGKKEIKEYHT